MSFWFAAPPAMTQSPQPGPVVADWTPSKGDSVAWFVATALFGVLSLALVASGAYPFLVATLPLAALASLAWVAVRRSYLAVGDGWLSVRTGL